MNSRSQATKRKIFTLSQKVKFIKLIDSKEKTQTQICDEYKIPPGTMSGIYKRRDEILKLCEENVLAADKQKIKSSKYDDMEIALVEWIRDKVCNGIPIDGPIVMTKAEQYAIRFNYSDFKPNPGWLERFKNRFSIKFTKKHGESGAVE
ncbi:tigger transposable element-derived 4 [Brachionus plicatilis]|uniref:Tigger transposable element-derived 4 n=1 Tax=Brachionus plicatilis TaxID=10195 RepID=A0A3M7SJA1_BRAPC|nr:tigger transposable element-derived 4 [Brachionus plicatilis]